MDVLLKLMNTSSLIEFVAVITALFYVLLAMQERPWCWFFAIVSSVCYIFVFMATELFTEAMLQFFFIGISIQGFFLWQGGQKQQAPSIHFGSRIRNIQGVLLCLVLTVSLGEFTRRYTGASLAYPDAAITIFSIYATFLAKDKRIENWLYWVIIDSGAVVLYGVKELYLTAVLFGLYVFLALLGFYQWKKKLTI